MSETRSDEAGEAEPLAYVLNLMEPEERRTFEERLLDDPELADEVWQLEEALSPLATAVRERRPRPRVGRAVVERLFPAPRMRVVRRPGTVWQLSTDAFFAATVAALTAVAILLSQPAALLPGIASPQLVAGVPIGADGAPAVLLVRRAGPQSLVLSALPNEDPAHSHQVWLVADDATPYPIGLIPEEVPRTVTLSPETLALFAEGARIIVTVEPPGGSPTNLPTGPVAGSAPLRAI